MVFPDTTTAGDVHLSLHQFSDIATVLLYWDVGELA